MATIEEILKILGDLTKRVERLEKHILEVKSRIALEYDDLIAPLKFSNPIDKKLLESWIKPYILKYGYKNPNIFYKLLMERGNIVFEITIGSIKKPKKRLIYVVGNDFKGKLEDAYKVALSISKQHPKDLTILKILSYSNRTTPLSYKLLRIYKNGELVEKYEA